MGDMNQNPEPVVSVGGDGDGNDKEKWFLAEEESVGISDQNENPLVSLVESQSGDGEDEGSRQLSEDLVELSLSDKNDNPLVSTVDGNGDDGEQFYASEEFMAADTAVDWDMLMSRGSSSSQPTRTHWERDSLYVKFDPLVASKTDQANRLSFIFKAPKPPGPSTSMKSVRDTNSNMSFTETDLSFVSCREDFTISIMEEGGVTSPNGNSTEDETITGQEDSSPKKAELSELEPVAAQSPKNVAAAEITKEHPNCIDAHQTAETVETLPTITVQRPDITAATDISGEHPNCTDAHETTDTVDTLPTITVQSPKDIATTIATDEESQEYVDNDVCMMVEDSTTPPIIAEGSPNGGCKNESATKNVSMSMTMLAEGLMNLNLVEESFHSDSDTDTDHNSHNATVITNELGSPNANSQNKSIVSIVVPEVEHQPLNGNVSVADEGSKNISNATFIEEALVNLSLEDDASRGRTSSGRNSTHSSINNGEADTQSFNKSMETSKLTHHVESNKDEDTPTQLTTSPSPSPRTNGCNEKSNGNVPTSIQNERFDRIAQIKERINKLKLEDEEQKKSLHKEAVETEMELSKAVDEYIKEKEKYEESEKSAEKMVEERDQALQDLQEMESRFAEMLMMYEGVKSFHLKIEKNNETLQQREVILKQILEKHEERDRAANQAYEGMLETMNQEFEHLIKGREDENIKLNAKVRMSEMKTTKLEGEIAQVKRENAKLQALCDDLVQK